MRLNTENMKKAMTVIPPEFLNTPQYICEPLSEVLGCNLLVKVETINPVRSFKGRGASFYVAGQEAGATVVCASAGNFGQAIAYACRAKGLEAVVFAAKNASSVKIERMRDLGAKVILQGADFDEAKVAAKAFASEHGYTLVEDSSAVETCEGAGTIGVELLQYGKPIDVVLVALGNGAMLTGVAAWVKANAPSTKVVGIVAKGANAMQQSFYEEKVMTTETATTIADGIAVRVPIPEVLEDMWECVDDVFGVTDEEIIKAMRLIHEHVGIVPEPSAAVGVAEILRNPERYAGKTVATILCGGNLSKEQMKKWL